MVGLIQPLAQSLHTDLPTHIAQPIYLFKKTSTSSCKVAVDTIPKREVTVFIGDMNAKIGKLSSIDIFLFRNMVKGKSQRQL